MRARCRWQWGWCLISAIAIVGAAGAWAQENSRSTTQPNRSGSAIVAGEKGAAVHDWLTRMERFGMHGAIVIEHQGETILRHGYGTANRTTGEPITADTVFHIGSLGKQFTAAGILLLQQRGKLDVNDTIDTYLQDVPEDKKLITIHHLLTHTSGLPYQPLGSDVLSTPLQSKPGEHWSYSNPGYRILHDILETVSGESYCTFMRENFFTPLGMSQTDCTGEPYAGQKHLAVAYTDETEQGTVVDFGRNEMFYGAGDFASTVGDMLIWEHSLRDNRILTEASTTAMFTEQAKNPGSRMGYGYGWMTMETIRGTRLVMHGGNLGGFNSDYRRYIDEDLTIIFLSNHFLNGRSMRDAVMNNVSLLINGGDAMAVLEVPATSDADVSHLAGTYELESGAQVMAEAAGNALMLTSRDQQAMMLLFAPSPDSQRLEQCRVWADATAEVITGIARNDSLPMRQYIAAALPTEPAWQGVRGMFTMLTAEHGAFEGAHVYGVAPSSDGRSGKCFAVIEFADGAQPVQFTWTGAGIIHMTTVDGPPAQRFLPAADGGLIAFDIFTGQAVRIGIEDGVTPALRLGSGDAHVTARKM